MPLMIHGLAYDKYFKKQRIDESRIEPIRLPLDETVTKELVGISAEDAWLPLTLALAERLHRLTNLICGGSHVPERITGDEYLFQMMRTSLFNMLGGQPWLEETRDLISEGIPAKLPTSGELRYFGIRETSESTHSFETIQQALIKDAVTLEILPDTRTVEDALTSFDARLGVIGLTHYQNVLRRADELELTDHERDTLRQSIRSEQRRLRNGIPQYLAMVLEILDRIEEIWNFLYPDTRSLQRYTGDELAYQGYRSLLARSLSSHEYRDVLGLANQTIPRLLPLRADLVATNPLIMEMPAHFERLTYEIVALAIQLGEPVAIDYANEPDLDSTFEEELWHWENLERGVSEFRVKAERDRKGLAPQSGRARRRGRPASLVTYDLAATVWWKLHEAFDDKPPTQKEISEHLDSLGYTISYRTLRKKILEWTAHNLKWPPAKDRSEAA